MKIIVPYQAGQGTDVGARLFAEQLTKALGQQVYVDNKPGAGGNIGTAEAARSPTDGYTLLMGTVATQTMNEFLYPSVGYDSQKDFEPIALVGMLPMVISANPSFAANSVAELVAAAKAKPDKIDIALPSTTARLVFELLKDRSGAPLFGVPYKGSATAMQEATGGQLPVIIDTATATRGQVAGGKLKLLGITTLRSSELMPGVKSVAEQGFRALRSRHGMRSMRPRERRKPSSTASMPRSPRSWPNPRRANAFCRSASSRPAARPRSWRPSRSANATSGGR